MRFDFKKLFVDTKFIDSCLELLIFSCDFHRRLNLFIKNCETWTPQGATSVSSETHGQLEDWINNVPDGLIKRLSGNRGQQPRCAIEWRVTLWHLCTTSSVYRTAPAVGIGSLVLSSKNLLKLTLGFASLTAMQMMVRLVTPAQCKFG